MYLPVLVNNLSSFHITSIFLMNTFSQQSCSEVRSYSHKEINGASKMLQICVSTFLFLRKNVCHKQLKGGSIYFGSQFKGISPSWWRRCDEGKKFTSCQPGGKERHRKEPRIRNLPKTCFQ